MKKKENIITDEERRTQDMSAVAEYTGEMSNRAKLVAFEGDDYDDTPVKDESFSGRADNFWYHNKWKVIIVSVILVIAAVGIYQIIARAGNKTDLSVMYAGPANIHSEEAEKLKDALGEILSVDLDGDGQKKVYLFSFNYLNEKQAAYLIDEAKKKGYESSFDAARNRQIFRDYSDLVFTGECGVMFLDYALFENLRDSGGLAKLEDALGYVPEKSFDGYGVRICDTAAWERYPALHAMPQDTVVCLRSLSTAGGVMISSDDAKANYEAGERLMKDIFALTFREGE